VPLLPPVLSPLSYHAGWQHYAIDDATAPRLFDAMILMITLTPLSDTRLPQ